MDKKVSGLNKLVVPATRARVRPAVSIIGKKAYVGGSNVWAPAWFHSALAWLGQWYYDANNVRQRFQNYLAGSDVDPYAQLGATRLFLVVGSQRGFRLSIASDVDALASAEDGDEFPFTDEGIRDMYLALADSDAFARAKYCYVPCRIGIDLEPDLEAGNLQSGYDPATGLRAIVNGSAVSQIVPLDEFLKARNEQIYNPAPAIVPLVSALVYDLSQHNTLGATTFDLPTFYARDRITPTTHCVNRIDQTVLFPGGPGYDDAVATDLSLKSTTTTVEPDHVLTTYTFDRAKVATISTLKPRVQTGISGFTYAGSSPTALFGSQRFVGFYRESSWTMCFGQPMYDFGPANDAFKATRSEPIDAPALIYDPAHGSLNGGSLQNVVHTLQQARLLSWDRLVYLLDHATTSGDDRAHGLAVTAADLAFELRSPPPGPIVDHLEVPVVVTVTTTPKPPPTVRRRVDVELAARPAFLAKVIGGGANTPVTPPSSQTSTQLGLVASVPREALSGTSISSIQIGTAFPEQALGSSAAFRASSTPRVVNVAAHHPGGHEIVPIDVALSSLGVELRDGIYYVLAATNQEVSVRGSDGSNQTAKLSAHAAEDTTYVGALVHGADSTSVRLYPKQHAGIAAPAVGTHGVLQGSAYSIRITVGEKHSNYDLLDASHVIVASNVQIKTPKLADGSALHPGDLLFGGFLGGAAEVTVWSVPVFVTVAPTDLPAGTFDGAIALDAQVSGVPAYKLHVTDSSVFVYYNIDVGQGSAGAPATSNVFLASAVINTAPDDRSAKAFAPSRVVMGLVREVAMGTARKYVFIPAEDSIVIGGVRYMLSVIELEALTFDPEDRPYPPSFWPRTQFWQFANRHDPYVDVRYSGETQGDRIAVAQEDSKRIGHEVRRAREPMHMYLDTDRELMTVWPIIGFPFDRATQNIDRGKLAAITEAVLELIADAPAMSREKAPRPLDSERIVVPDALLQVNPYGGAAAATKATVGRTLSMEIAAPTVLGKPVTSLGGPMFATNASGIDRHESMLVHAQERVNAANAVNKTMLPGIEVLQDHELQIEVTANKPEKRKPVIYGYSVLNRRTGEAYLIELVDADQDVPDQLPHPTEHLTYDPFYVRVVDLATLTAYNMSIIVPAMVHDQYGHFATVNTTYENVVAKTDELTLGYMYSLFDAADAFDSLTFRYTSESRHGTAMMAAGTHALFTNVPYALDHDDKAEEEGTPYFVCRRRNWSADCHLMKAKRLKGRSVYVAFGAGDLVPFRLDADFTIDKRPPAHLYKLTYTFPDRQYDAAKIISVANKPYVVGLTTQSGAPQYMNFSINSTSGTTDLSVTPNTPLDFPKEIYVVGSASTTLISIDDINAQAGTTLRNTGDLMTLNDDLTIAGQEFQLIPYNNLVYMVRAVANVAALGTVGNLGTVSGLLIDTFVPATSGNLVLAQGARHKRSGLSYFGASYTPTTMVDTLDNLDFTSITGENFLVPTIFIPIPELDATRGFIADISNFLGQQFWTFIYPEIVAHAGDTKNGVTWTRDVNIDVEGKPVLSMQKLHFVYDPLVVLFTPNDLSHKYALQPKQQVLALTNGQVQEGICWRSANLQPQRDAPTNICAQQIVPAGPLFDRPNIIYSSHNRAVDTSNTPGFLGMSVNSFFSVSGVTYSIEESALQNDQTATSFISAVSSTTNMLVGVLFDYDNNDLGNLVPYNRTQSTKGVVFLNGYLSATGYSFSSPDHFDVNDVLPSQVPRLEQIANTLGEDVAFFETDVSLPRQFWSMAYDTFTAPGVPGYISNVPPSLVDPSFSNRTRSLILSLQNPLRPDQLGLMDTFSSVVSANIHLQNGVTGSVFISKKADRDVASIGTNPVGPNSFPLYGLPTKYDFFIFSRDHYWTLKGASFELVDQGYAMCLVDDGSGTGTKVAKYFVDSDGNYYELFTYALYSPNGGLIETSSFTVRVSLGAAGNVSASPIIPATPNNVNPQDLAAQINKVSNLVYAAFGPSSSGQPPAFIPIQAVGGAVQATPIVGPPDFGGYRLNVAAANRQPVQISQLYSGTVTYPIAGSTAVAPLSKSGKAQPFLGSLSHGLDRMLPWPALSTADHTVVIPRTTVPAGPSTATLGGNGLGSLIGTPFSCAFQGSGAVPPAIAANPTPGTTMKADDTVFYSFNAVTSTVMDSTGKSASASGTYYFVDKADTANPIYAVVTLPRFTLSGNTYAVNLSTTLANGTTSRYSLVVGGKSYLFGPDNAHVTVDRTQFTFQPISGGVYNVLCSALDSPTGDQAPATIALTPFSVTAGGVTATIDVFNNAGALGNILLGIAGRQYAFDPVHGRITIVLRAIVVTA